MAGLQPFFSIVIPTYNRPKELTACLESLTRLDYPRDCFEVVVVDDGSKMSLDAVIAHFQKQLNLTLISQANAGPATARNTGAKYAQGEFLAFIDDDCTPATNWVKALANRFATTPDCMVGGQTIDALPNNPYSTGSQLLVDYLYQQYNADLYQAGFLASNNMAFPATAFRNLGGFDTSFPLAAGEDREFCDRWLARGNKTIYAPEVLIYHAHHLNFMLFLATTFQLWSWCFLFLSNIPTTTPRQTKSPAFIILPKITGLSLFCKILPTSTVVSSLVFTLPSGNNSRFVLGAVFARETGGSFIALRASQKLLQLICQKFMVHGFQLLTVH